MTDSHICELIIYFSRGGNTEEPAKYAQQVLDADIYELVAVDNYAATVARATSEREPVPPNTSLILNLFFIFLLSFHTLPESVRFANSHTLIQMSFSKDGFVTVDTSLVSGLP
ncbi:MAG: hypothetical protein ACE3JK_09945 [Sporolactobacillus sp.]